MMGSGEQGVLSDWGREVKLPLIRPFCDHHHSRGSLASLRGRRGGRRMMGSGEQGVPICFTTLRPLAGRIEILNGIALPIVPTGTTWFAVAGKSFVAPLFLGSGCGAAGGAPGSLPKRNSVWSRHMRCRMTASLRATATRARAMPRRLAICMPQARRLDHLRLRTSNVWAAS